MCLNLPNGATQNPRSLSFLLEIFTNLSTSFNIAKVVTVTAIALRSIFLAGAMITFHSSPETAL